MFAILSFGRMIARIHPTSDTRQDRRAQYCSLLYLLGQDGGGGEKFVLKQKALRKFVNYIYAEEQKSGRELNKCVGKSITADVMGIVYIQSN